MKIITRVHTGLLGEDRLRWLADQLAASGTVAIPEAADALGVSEMTIRRDIAELERRGTARRVRGGAAALGPQPFGERHRTGTRAKAAIATKLAKLVPHTGAVALDASSTVMRLASALDRARDLTVLTNGPDTFAALQNIAHVTPLLTGGQLDLRTGSLVGPLACRSAQQVAVDAFFASCAGVADAGSFEPTLEEADVKRNMASGARLVVLAADASKLGDGATALGLEWDQIDILVTELDPNDKRLRPFRALTKVR